MCLLFVSMVATTDVISSRKCQTELCIVALTVKGFLFLLRQMCKMIPFTVGHSTVTNHLQNKAKVTLSVN